MWGLLQRCSWGPRLGGLPAPRELLLLSWGLDLFYAQREKAGLDFDLGYSCTEPLPLVFGKPELAQVLRAIKTIQFHHYQILLKTKDVATPWEGTLQSQVSLAWKCVLSLDPGPPTALQHSLPKVILLNPLHMCH